MGRLKKVLFCSYRDWSNEICKKIKNIFLYDDINFKTCDTQDKFLNLIKKEKFDIIFFLGWSDIIEKEIVENNLCVCLHPSLLPYYRGGSPLQNQLINNEKESGITFFMMNESLDKGPILYQEKYNLEKVKLLGLTEIYKKITNLGIRGVKKIILDLYKNKELNLIISNDKGSYYKRRNPKQSEIKVSDFKYFTAEEIFNKIIGLQDPYPNAFIKCKDGTKLFLTNAKYEKQ
jgi:methionyl-tRNA formyltransferase